MSVYEKLKALNIELPAVATPAAAYVMFVQTGNTVYLSGHIAKKDGKPWVGQLGKNLTTEEGMKRGPVFVNPAPEIEGSKRLHTVCP